MYHCLLIPTDLTLTTDKLTELFQSVEDPDEYLLVDLDGGRDEIIGFGKFFGLPESEIEKKYQSTAEQKEAELVAYIHRHPCPSWKKIHELLRQCLLKQQADEVEDTYIQGILYTSNTKVKLISNIVLWHTILYSIASYLSIIDNSACIVP